MSKTTHIVAVLDRSGSMGGTEVEVINSFNNFIDKQRKIEGKAKVTLVLFDDDYEIVWNKMPLKQVPKLTEDTYYVRGMTSLNDALGKTISRFNDKKRVIFLIQTDGWENSSREFTGTQVKKMIKDKDNWEFIFIGSDLSEQDTIKMSAGFGIAPGKTFAFTKSAMGALNTGTVYASATTSYRSSGKPADKIDTSDVVQE